MEFVLLSCTVYRILAIMPTLHGVFTLSFVYYLVLSIAFWPLCLYYMEFWPLCVHFVEFWPVSCTVNNNLGHYAYTSWSFSHYVFTLWSFGQYHIVQSITSWAITPTLHGVLAIMCSLCGVLASIMYSL